MWGCPQCWIFHTKFNKNLSLVQNLLWAAGQNLKHDGAMSFCLPSQNKEHGRNTENNRNTSNKPFIFAVQVRNKIHDFSMVKYFMTKFTNYQHQKCIMCLMLKQQLYIMYFQYMFLLWCTALACSSCFKNVFVEGTRVQLT